MLPKKERLSRAEFNRFFSVGKRLHTPLFTLIYATHQSLHASVVVPKKIAQHAVDRNKIRRRIYDIVRRRRAEGLLHGVFIFLVQSKIKGETYQHIKEAIETAINQTQKYKS